MLAYGSSLGGAGGFLMSYRELERTGRKGQKRERAQERLIVCKETSSHIQISHITIEKEPGQKLALCTTNVISRD